MIELVRVIDENPSLAKKFKKSKKRKKKKKKKKKKKEGEESGSESEEEERETKRRGNKHPVDSIDLSMHINLPTLH